jgi:hypothetical protein
LLRLHACLRIGLWLALLSQPAAAEIQVAFPPDGATIDNPARLVATATPSAGLPVTFCRVYVDSNSLWAAATATMDAALALSAGDHHVVFQCWDSAGNVQRTERRVRVVNSSTPVVSSPAAGSTASDPVRVVASLTGASAIAVYVDNQLAYKKDGDYLDQPVAMSSGTRYVVVQGWVNGAAVKTALTLIVSGSGVPGTARVYGSIDQMTGWESCDKCSGPGGDGSTTPHSMKQFVASPSLDGKSIEFFLGGTTAYASALWWKQLGAWDAATSFLYELKFYYTDHSAVQALEFDANQSVNGRKHIFGTECNVRHTKTWRVWNADPNVAKRGSWVDTGVPCILGASKWHALKWEFKRLSDGRVQYIAVTLNGQRYLINRSYNSEPSSVRELNVAFQMDGNSSMTDYKVWVDQVKLTAW